MILSTLELITKFRHASNEKFNFKILLSNFFQFDLSF